MAANIQLNEGTSGKYAKTTEVSAGVHIGNTVLVTSGGTEVAPLTDTQLRATALPVSGTVAVTNAGITTIAGAVSGTEMQVDVLTMPSVAVTNAGITTIAGAVAGTEMQVDVLTMPSVAVTNAGITSIDSKITACNTGAVVVSSGTITGITNAIAVTGTFYQATQPVSIATAPVLVAGDANIGNVDIVTMPTNVPTTIGSGTTTVTTAGTRVALAGSTACRRVSICAKEANTGRIFYGGNAVSATSGAFLYAGASADIEISNLSSVYIDSSVNGEGVQYTYVA